MRIEIFSRFTWSGMRKQWYFRIKAGNGEAVAQSEGYTRKESAVATANMLRKTLNTATIEYVDES